MGNTYHGGERMVGGGLTHSPHYHLLHYAESDPLMGHMGGWRGGGGGGGDQASVTAHQSHTGRGETRGKWKVGRQFGSTEAHRSTAHKTQKQWGKSGLGEIRC